MRGHQKHNDIKYRVQLEKYKVSFVKQIFVINRSNYQQISNESLGCLFINYQSTAVLITLFLYTCLFMIYNFAFFYLNSFEQLFIFSVTMFPSLNLWLQSKKTARKPTVEKQKDFDGTNKLREEKGIV